VEILQRIDIRIKKYEINKLNKEKNIIGFLNRKIKNGKSLKNN